MSTQRVILITVGSIAIGGGAYYAALSGNRSSSAFPAPRSVMYGLVGLQPGAASAPCRVPPDSGSLSVLADTGLPASAIDWPSCRFEHSDLPVKGTLTWQWNSTIEEVRVETSADVLVQFTLNGLPIVWAGRCDFNLDGFVNGIDSDLFHNLFEVGDQRADYNNDGFVDGLDSDLWNNAWESRGPVLAPVPDFTHDNFTESLKNRPLQETPFLSTEVPPTNGSPPEDR